MAQKPSREEVERRAYEIYLERGGQDGRDVDDWFAAEAELSAQAVPEPVIRPTPQATPQTTQQKSATAGGRDRS